MKLHPAKYNNQVSKKILEENTKKSFTNQQPRLVTDKDLPGNWGGHKDGRKFHCNLCGYKFKLGDYWRFNLSTDTYSSFFVCEECDHGDAIQKWKDINDQIKKLIHIAGIELYQ